MILFENGEPQAQAIGAQSSRSISSRRCVRRSCRSAAPVSQGEICALVAVDDMTDADLYRRGAETLVASWREYARGANGAAVRRLPGVVVAVFPDGPERVVYNNALIARDLTAAERRDALDSMEDAYAAAGVVRFAAWVHESDCGMRDAVEARGYTVDESTRAMAMA